jgi:hypothetical protein
MTSTKRQRYPAWAKKEVPLADTNVPEASARDHPMNSEESQRVFSKIKEWWLQARETQSFVRLQMDVDESFYHGDQYTDEDRRALEDVGQAPLVFNKTKPVVDWLIGTERRTRVDFNVLPRHKGKESEAQVKKDVLKYISDVSKAPFARSEAAKEAFISGLGWLEVGVRADSSDDPLYISQETWRNIWYDALGTKKDTSDWRYLFRSKWTDLDIGQAMFPDFAVELRAAATSINVDLTTKDDDEFYIGQRFSHRDRAGNLIGIPSYTDVVNTQVNNRRERIRLVEAWYRMPLKGQKVKGGIHHGRVVNLKNQRMMFELNSDIDAGKASVYDAVVMQVYCAVFCEGTLLQNMRSPYHHNRFPFVPIWGYRKGKFHEPYGVVRNCRDPQEDLNKRYSKALFLLSSTRLIADRNAVQDWESLREEVGRPDAQLLLDTPKARFEIHTEQALAEEQVKLMQHDGLHIQEISGVTSENLGRDTNAISGRAVLAKQTQGSVVSAELFDNLRQAQQLLGELTLSTAEQFYTEAKAIRISGERGAVQWRDINNEDGTNDITATQMDYIVSEQDFRDTMKQAMYESLMDTISKMDPQIALKLLDAVVDLSDFPGKEELVRRIRAINGQLPPPDQQTEQEKKQAVAMEQKAQEAEAIKQKAIQLEFAEKQSKIDKATAEAERIRAEIPTLGADGKVRSEMEAKLAEVDAKNKQAQDALRAEVAKNNAELANRQREIESKRQTEIDVANIKANAEKAKEVTAAAAQIEVARITSAAEADAAKTTAEAADTLAALQSQVEHHKGERDRVAKEANDKMASEAASRKESEARAEKQKQEAEHKAKEKQAADEKQRKESEQKAEKQRKEDQAAQEKKDKVSAGAQASHSQPIHVNVHVAAPGTTKRTSTIKKNPDGTIRVVSEDEAGPSKK